MEKEIFCGEPWPTRALASVLRGCGRLAKRRMEASYSDLRALLWREPQEERVEAGGISLSCLHWPWPGRGTPLLLLHGVNSVAWAWARAAALLAAGREVYALSLRGHGDSEIPPTGYALPDTDRDLAAFLDALGLPRVDLGGESWGGKVATHFAATHPGRVRALLLADPVLPWGLDPLLKHFPFLMRAALAFERSEFRDREVFERVAARTVYLPLWDAVDRRSWYGRFFEDNGRFRPRLPDQAYEEILEKAIGVDISEKAAGIKAPILFLLPDLSISFWPGELRRLHRLWPKMKQVQITGDHTFISGNPAAAAREIEIFLAGIDAESH